MRSVCFGEFAAFQSTQWVERQLLDVAGGGLPEILVLTSSVFPWDTVYPEVVGVCWEESIVTVKKLSCETHIRM